MRNVQCAVHCTLRTSLHLLMWSSSDKDHDNEDNDNEEKDNEEKDNEERDNKEKDNEENRPSSLDLHQTTRGNILPPGGEIDGNFLLFVCKTFPHLWRHYDVDRHVGIGDGRLRESWHLQVLLNATTFHGKGNQLISLWYFQCCKAQLERKWECFMWSRCFPSIRRIISHFMFPFLFRPVLCGSSGTSGKDGPPPHGRYIPSIERRGRQNNFSDMSLLGGFASRRSHWKIRKHKRWKLLPKYFT